LTELVSTANSLVGREISAVVIKAVTALDHSFTFAAIFTLKGVGRNQRGTSGSIALV
jgi:hypothetical protein